MKPRWALGRIKEKRFKENSEALRKGRKACEESVRKAKKAHQATGLEARRINRINNEAVRELNEAQKPVPPELKDIMRYPTKDPTESELEALLPNPSLVQNMAFRERGSRDTETTTQSGEDYCCIDLSEVSDKDDDSMGADSMAENDDLISSKADFDPLS